MRKIVMLLGAMLIIMLSACGKEYNEPESAETIGNEEATEKKTVVNFGDSILANFQSTYGEHISVSGLIAEQTGWNVINAGFGGCLMQKHPVEGWESFSMYELADAFVSGDWSKQEMSIAKEKELNLPYYFKDTISVLKKMDWNSVDIITISYGTNDWKYGEDSLILGEGEETFAGSLKHSIEKIREKYPSIKIVVQTPTPRITIADDGEITGDSDTELNRFGKTLVDFVELEKEICKEYNIPVIDAYSDLGYFKDSHSLYYYSESDGVHLSLEGRKALAEEISEFLIYEL